MQSLPLLFAMLLVWLAGARVESTPPGRGPCTHADGRCHASDDAMDDAGLGLLQAKAPGKQHAAAPGPQTCQVGDSVACPGEAFNCAGGQCCPGAAPGEPSFPCPSAADGWGTGQCQTPVKKENCLAPEPTPLAPPAPAPTPRTPPPGGSLGQYCAKYLQKKSFTSPEVLQQSLGQACSLNITAQRLYAPDPAPSIPGASDTTHMACRYGNPCMFSNGGTCCGMRPHFNWIVATCEPTHPGAGQFCAGLPQCLINGSPRINYVAAYQFDGTSFVLMDESSVGELSSEGISGDFTKGTGWEAKKDQFLWAGGEGDWTTKYAPWGTGPDGPKPGPRGLTPPAHLYVLSAENFYYGAFYMLTQQGLNLQGLRNPTGTNCWMWELDPVEGTAGWSPGERMPGNVNMLYSKGSAQASGCMLMAYTSNQLNGFRQEFLFPEEFREYCAASPEATGCRPWKESIWWSGSDTGSDRFENLWDEPYVFAVVVDKRGYWIYRWRPAVLGNGTGWSGLGRFQAARALPPRPAAVTDARGLRTDVPGDATEAVIWQPSVYGEAACLRASVEEANWEFGSAALAAMAGELRENRPGGKFETAQSWWEYFVDTRQNQGYPLSIAGVPRSQLDRDLTCGTASSATCSCRAEFH